MLKIIQTSDPFKYAPMIKISSVLNEFYCNLHGYEYFKFIGLKRGTSPIHATYNRAYLLKDLLDQGYRDWVLYLDADAYIHDLTFNVSNYLNDKKNYSFIAAEAAVHLKENWCINAGIFFINLGSNEGQFIVNALHHQFERLVPEVYWNDANANWAPPEYDDQNILCSILAGFPEIISTVYKAPKDQLNYKSNSFRQILRADGTLDERIKDLRVCCKSSLDYFLIYQMPKFIEAYTVLNST